MALIHLGYALTSEPDNAFLAWLKSGIVGFLVVAALLVVSFLSMAVCGAPLYH